MKIITYETAGKSMVGVLSPDELSVRAISGASSLSDIFALSDDGIRARMEEEPVDVQKIKLLAPIPRPAQDILCLGVNYIDHARESEKFGAADFTGPRKYPAYFGKRVNFATASGEEIPWYKDIDAELDYETELAVIIGREARNVTREAALKYVFGYTIMNDVTARTIQRRHLQWYMGKSLDGYCPMGPCVVTQGSVDYKNLAIRTYVNGEVRQQSNTSLQMFDIPYVISELSTLVTLPAGTIIATGTPSGVGAGLTPPKFLRPGDEVICEIEGIGRLINKVGK